jgi:hypothetical protein
MTKTPVRHGTAGSSLQKLRDLIGPTRNGEPPVPVNVGIETTLDYLWWFHNANLLRQEAVVFRPAMLLETKGTRLALPETRQNQYLP